MKTWQPTVGLEIHAELSTASKMFCACINNPDEIRPNVNICPICMAHPGTLPVINREAVHKILLVGVALHGKLADRTIFDRKNYFYPDIPKGFQISQYENPLVSGGELAGIQITRVHLEEDTARSTHDGGESGVDFNRSSVPLMELVTEPVIHSAEEAGKFARELQLLLRYLKASEANMEKGEMRVEANVSVSDSSTLGTKVEVKNLNSFRSVERAIAYEIDRQIHALENGEKIVQETRGWDENKQVTFAQRKKESSHDYRYFPEPDLPQLIISQLPDFAEEKLKAELPELPEIRRARYMALGIKKEDADLFVRSPFLGDFIDTAITHDPGSITLMANYCASDLAGKLESGEVDHTWLTDKENARRFAALINLIAQGLLSSRGAKDTLALMLTSGDEPKEIATKNGLIQESDESRLKEIVKKIVENNSEVVKEYRAGKTAALQFLVGQGMKETKGSANPGMLRKLFEEMLSQGS